MVSRAFCGPIDRGSEGATEGEIFKAAFPPLLTLPEFPLTRLTSGHLRLRPHDRAEVFPSPAEGLRARAWARRRGPPPCPRTELDSAGPAPAALRTLPGGSGAPARAPHPAVPVRQRRRAERPAGRIRSPRPHAALVCAGDTGTEETRFSRCIFARLHAHTRTRAHAHARTLPGCPPGSRAAPRATRKPRPRPGSAAPKRALLKRLRLGTYCTENEDEQFEKHFFIR